MLGFGERASTKRGVLLPLYAVVVGGRCLRAFAFFLADDLQRVAQMPPALLCFLLLALLLGMAAGGILEGTAPFMRILLQSRDFFVVANCELPGCVHFSTVPVVTTFSLRSCMSSQRDCR